MGKPMLHFFSIVFHSIFFILAGTHEMDESLEEFDIRQDPTIDCGVNCLERLKKNSIDTMGKTVLPPFLGCS